MTQQQSRNKSAWGLGLSVIPMFFVALLLCTFGSCKDDNGLEREEKMVTFSLDLTKGFTPATYAMTFNDENRVATIDVLVFDNSGKFFSGPHSGLISGTDVTVGLPDEVADNFTIAVFANSRAEVNDAVPGMTTGNTSKNDALRLITFGHTNAATGGWNSTPGTDGYKSIPMYGEATKGSLATNSVQMTRALARINVSLAGGTLSNFTLKTVHFVNYNTKGYVANVATGGNVEVPANAQVAGFAAAQLYNASSNAVKQEIYTFEANAGTSEAITTNPCLIIGGTYKSIYAEDIDYYYRIDFVDNAGNYLPIRRNYTYNIAIAAILGSGHTSAQDAFGLPASNIKPNIDYLISSWDGSNLVEADCNGAVQREIEVSAGKMEFDSAARDANNGDNILFVRTDSPDGWTADIVDASSGQPVSWLSLLSMDGTPFATCADLAASHYPFSTSEASPVKLKMSANNTGAPRTAIVNIKAGATIHLVEVVQSNVANNDPLFRSEADSYTLFTSPYQGKIYIPVSRANGIGGKIELNDTDDFTAEIIDANGVVASVEQYGIGKSGYVAVETGTTGGSAKIAIKKGTETICTWTINTIEPVIESEKANSYIVAPNSGILLPVSQANASTDLGTQLNAGDAYAVELVWTDNLKGISISLESTIWSISPYGTGDTGQVLVGTGKEVGNAVVGIRKKDANGNATGGFLWSWHIWVTDYNPDENSPSSGYFMDRNLGALNNGFVNGSFAEGLIDNFDERSKSMGLHYQWGRKDPFPTSTTGFNTTATSYFGNSNYGEAGTQKTLDINSISSSTYPAVSGSSSDNNLGYAVANPHIFYSNAGDWYCTNSSNRNDNLWGGTADTKTVYDPCPHGWRVPNDDIWKTAKNNKEGTLSESSGGAMAAAGWTWSTNGYSVTYTSSGSSWWASDQASAFFPASGYRDYSNGDLNSVGSRGSYWSASPSNENARYQIFNSTYLPPPGPDGNLRATGYSVRCSKE